MRAVTNVSMLIDSQQAGGFQPCGKSKRRSQITANQRFNIWQASCPYKGGKEAAMRRSILAMLVAGAAILPVRAQQPYPQTQPYPQQQVSQADEGDAPDHGVARISLVNGEVSVRHGDAGEITWRPAPERAPRSSSTGAT
jgi:hypothetical protein